MGSVKMIYQPNETTSPSLVDVYSFNHTYDTQGNILDIIVTAWNSSTKNWLTAPIWCFKPIESKSLNEG